MRFMLLAFAFGACSAAQSGARVKVALEVQTFDCGSEVPAVEVAPEQEWLRDGRLKVSSWETVLPYKSVDSESGQAHLEQRELSLSYQIRATAGPPPSESGRPIPIDICPYFAKLEFFVSGLPKDDYDIKIVQYRSGDGG